MNKLRMWSNKVIGHLGSLTGWLVVITITLGGVIVLIKEIQWFLKLLGVM